MHNDVINPFYVLEQFSRRAHFCRISCDAHKCALIKHLEIVLVFFIVFKPIDFFKVDIIFFKITLNRQYTRIAYNPAGHEMISHPCGKIFNVVKQKNLLFSVSVIPFE